MPNLQPTLSQLLSYLPHDPHNVPLLLDTFYAALRASDASVARQLLERLQANDRVPAERKILLASELAMAFSDWPKAVDVLSGHHQPAKADEFHLAVMHNLAYAYWRMQQPVDSLNVLGPSFVQSLIPALHDETLQLALRAHHHAGDPKTASDLAQQLESMGRLSAASASIAALCALDAMQMSRARQWSAQALAQDPSVPEAALVKATLELADGRTQDALSLCDGLLKRYPSEARAWQVQGIALMTLGDLSGAAQALDRAMSLHPPHVATLQARAWTAIMAGELGLAESLLLQAVPLDPAFAETHGSLALVHALQHRRAEAEDEIALALRLDATCGSALFAKVALADGPLDGAAVQRLAHIVARRAARQMSGQEEQS